MMGCAAARTGGAMMVTKCVCPRSMPGPEPGRPEHRSDDGSGRSVVRAGKLRHASIQPGKAAPETGPAIGTPAPRLLRAAHRCTDTLAAKHTPRNSGDFRRA
jgi:hypothetical protein